MEEEILEFIHILGAAILLGTRFATGFSFLMARLNAPAKAGDDVIAVVARNVLWAEGLLVTPVVITQLVTGLWLMAEEGHTFAETWTMLALILYAAEGVLWIGYLYSTARLRRLAAGSGTKTPPSADAGWFRAWLGFGALSLVGLLVIYWLMIFKPGA